MILQPQSTAELAAQLEGCFKAGRKVTRVDLSNVASLVEHAPEDMTATVQAGMTLNAFQEKLRRAGQWLPIDPPQAETLTIGDLLANDRSGSRRLGYGTIRDYLIGIKVALAEGQVIKAGGKVVKNVAGYDLCKLFVGARHSLGVIVEGTFKLRPIPEMEMFVERQCPSIDDVASTSRKLLTSAAEPVLLDAYDLAGEFRVVAAFGGSVEDVKVQVQLAESFGFVSASPSNYAELFWTRPETEKMSVLPSRTVETIASMKPSQFLAHLGNGIIYSRGGAVPAGQPMPTKLMNRVKMSYDPKGILPACSA